MYSFHDCSDSLHGLLTMNRSYLEHVRATFGDRGPPVAFPLPAATRKKASSSGEPDGGGIESSPCLVRARVGTVTADIVPPASGEPRCRSLLVRASLFVPCSGKKYLAVSQVQSQSDDELEISARKRAPHARERPPSTPFMRAFASKERLPVSMALPPRTLAEIFVHSCGRMPTLVSYSLR